jgi:ubiquinone/menaquinone biosynthesis C-methylase UbiE
MLEEAEKKLINLVTKWTDNFAWRPDFLKWREERIWQENYQDKTIDFLGKFLPDLQNKKILDLGCGMGGFSVAMRRKGYNIVGLDPNADYCEITRLRGERYGLGLEVINSGGEKIPFADESFDLIFCNDVLEHCENPFLVVKESHRILKRGGQAYVTVINRFAFDDPHYHMKLINWLPRRLASSLIKIAKREKSNSAAGRQDILDMHYFTYRQFSKLAERAGFETVGDIKEYKVTHPQFFSSKSTRKIVKILNLLGISGPAYRFSRFLFQGGFTLILTKK